MSLDKSVTSNQQPFSKPLTPYKISRLNLPKRFFLQSEIDMADQLWFAMDLSPLVHDVDLDVIEYVGTLLDQFGLEVRERLESSCG